MFRRLATLVSIVAASVLLSGVTPSYGQGVPPPANGVVDQLVDTLDPDPAPPPSPTYYALPTPHTGNGSSCCNPADHVTGGGQDCAPALSEPDGGSLCPSGSEGWRVVCTNSSAPVNVIAMCVHQP